MIGLTGGRLTATPTTMNEPPQRVTTEQGEKLAQEYGIKFFETSAKEKINVDEAFRTIATDIVARCMCRACDS